MSDSPTQRLDPRFSVAPAGLGGHTAFAPASRRRAAVSTRSASLDQVLFVGLLATFVYSLVIDGYLRLSTGSEVAKLGRDVIPGAMIAILLIDQAVRPKPVRRVPLAGLVALFTLIVMTQVANPSALGIGNVVMAMRPHLEYVVLFVVAAMVLRDDHRLRALLVVLVVCGALNGAVGLAQSTLSPQQLSSWGPGYAALIEDNNPRSFEDSSGESRVRPPALGTDAGVGATVGLIALPAALAIILTAAGPRRWIAGAAVPLIVAGIATSQTRAGVLGAVFALIVFLLVTSARPGGGRTIAALGAVVVVLGLASTVLLKDQLITERYESIAPTRITSTFGEDRGGAFAFVPRYLQAYPLGAGVGTVGPGSSVAASSNRGQKNGENAFLYLTLETGIPGLLVMMALYFATMRLGFRLIKPRRYGQTSSLMAAALFSGVAGFALLWASGPVMVGPPFTLFFYTAAGCFAGRAAVAHASSVRERRRGRRAAAPVPGATQLTAPGSRG